MVCVVLAKENFRKVLVTTALASLNPKREWSVKTVGMSSREAIMRASWAREEKAEWPWTRVTFSVRRMWRR